MTEIERMDSGAFHWLHKHWECGIALDIRCNISDLHRWIPARVATPDLSSVVHLKEGIDTSKGSRAELSRGLCALLLTLNTNESGKAFK